MLVPCDLENRKSSIDDVHPSDRESIGKLCPFYIQNPSNRICMWVFHLHLFPSFFLGIFPRPPQSSLLWLSSPFLPPASSLMFEQILDEQPAQTQPRGAVQMKWLRTKLELRPPAKWIYQGWSWSSSLNDFQEASGWSCWCLSTRWRGPARRAWGLMPFPSTSSICEVTEQLLGGSSSPWAAQGIGSAPSLRGHLAGKLPAVGKWCQVPSISSMRSGLLVVLLELPWGAKWMLSFPTGSISIWPGLSLEWGCGWCGQEVVVEDAVGTNRRLRPSASATIRHSYLWGHSALALWVPTSPFWKGRQKLSWPDKLRFMFSLIISTFHQPCVSLLHALHELEHDGHHGLLVARRRCIWGSISLLWSFSLRYSVCRGIQLWGSHSLLWAFTDSRM